ncbi:unnamed protein product [Callosobruchus maculatus]|uniref:Uncharacterized protein n=1 Tax=Callosobruchus maculatus TaxID=64391 RepID=A0A653DGW2_CALMS|nr:unnamed protein product [Callosobruchus maculatus]
MTSCYRCRAFVSIFLGIVILITHFLILEFLLIWKYFSLITLFPCHSFT